jgi:hypothetical protein
MYVNAKMITVETISESEDRGIKESGGGGKFKCNIFDTL